MADNKDKSKPTWFEACVPFELGVVLDKITQAYLAKSEAERPYYILGLKQGGFIE